MAAGGATDADDKPVVTPKAAVETEAVPSKGDAADDPAIWVHPDEPGGASYLVLTKRAVSTSSISRVVASRSSRTAHGLTTSTCSTASRLRGRCGFGRGGHAEQSATGRGLLADRSGTRRLAELGPLPSFTVFNGGEPYGSCTYRSPRDRAFYVFVTNKDGNVEQYRLDPDSDSSIRATLVRSFGVGSTAEGCVADFDLGWLYIAEEKVGIWKYGAEPDSGSARTSSRALATTVSPPTLRG